MARCQARREEALVPVAGEEAPALARQLVGEVLAPGLRLRWPVAVKPGSDTDDLRTRLVAEAPGRKRDRGEVRLQMARRQADDQPPDPAGEHRRGFAAMTSTCQFIANGARGLSSRNERAAKLAKSLRRRAAHSRGIGAAPTSSSWLAHVNGWNLADRTQG